MADELGTSGGEVTIAGRASTIGGVHAPRPGTGPGAHKPRRLPGYREDSLLPGGTVTLAMARAGNLRTMTGEAWAARAGGEVRT